MDTRAEPNVLADTAAHPVVVFDGVCNLCSWSVNFILDRDPRGQFRFTAAQTPEARALLAPFGAVDLATASVLLVEDGRLYSRSTAALRIARRLRWPWPLLYAFVLVPSPLRDAVYRVVARNRYRWFGKADACRVPTPALRDRFLDSSPR